MELVKCQMSNCFVYNGSALGYQASLQAHHSNNEKQILQIQHNRLNIPAGRQTSWLFYKYGAGIELGSTEISSLRP